MKKNILTGALINLAMLLSIETAFSIPCPSGTTCTPCQTGDSCGCWDNSGQCCFANSKGYWQCDYNSGGSGSTTVWELYDGNLCGNVVEQDTCNIACGECISLKGKAEKRKK